jgi:superfamily II DNA helicase RecQ
VKHRFFKIPVHGGDAEIEANQFACSHRIVAVERQFVPLGLDSFWALCFRYQDGDENPALLRKGKIDYRDVLSEAEFVVFAKLRTLRKEISEREGLPPYALFTNEQLAAMVRQQIRTKADMGKIEGVGPARLEKYAEAFLAILKEQPAPAEAES